MSRPSVDNAELAIKKLKKKPEFITQTTHLVITSLRSLALFDSEEINKDKKKIVLFHTIHKKATHHITTA